MFKCSCCGEETELDIYAFNKQFCSQECFRAFSKQHSHSRIEKNDPTAKARVKDKVRIGK